MEPMNSLTKDSILSEEVFEEIFDQEDEIYKARLILSLEDRAQELGVKRKFTELLRAYKNVDKASKKSREKKQVSLLENWTNFQGPYDNMQCGTWIATEDGIYLQNQGSTDILACYHPILPVERLKNLETGEEQIKLAYKRNGRWEEIIVPKTMVTSANKIVSLSGRGISVTSENAKFLVRYLADVENFNDGSIEVQYSSSKLGWIHNGFLPYDKDIIFDGNSRFRQLYDSIGERGSRNKWFEHMRELRASGRIEIKFFLAASFASVLVGILGGLPFFVDLWGETEGGKSVTMMIACSVWANPDESQYIGDFKSTDVALEARADMLNNLPVMLDDTSKKNRKIEENFEGLVYDLCSGKGKSRSNKELGMNRENHWKNCILTNGERPLNSYVTQGGAVNRILEIECGEKVYKDPQKTVEIVKNNYGFAGKEFVQIIKDMGINEIRAIQEEIQKSIFNDEKMQKQSISLSIVLTADKIATEWLFKDGQYISMDEAENLLIDRNEVSDNERCYQFILGEVAVNAAKFDPVAPTAEKWGCMDNGYVVIYNNAFDAICKKGGFSKKAFLSWADKKGLLQTQGANQTKVKKVNGTAIRCVFLRLDDDLEIDKDGFMSLKDGAEETPF
jgi:hypothetical protein